MLPIVERTSGFGPPMAANEAFRNLTDNAQILAS